MTIAAGTHLGRYEIRSKIGAGGMGEVYLAQHMTFDRKVARLIRDAKSELLHEAERYWRETASRI
jgi:serine/threonine protein kinase